MSVQIVTCGIGFHAQEGRWSDRSTAVLYLGKFEISDWRFQIFGRGICDERSDSVTNGRFFGEFAGHRRLEGARGVAKRVDLRTGNGECGGDLKFQILDLRWLVSAGGVAGGEGIVEGFEECVGALFVAVEASALLGEVALAFDIGVLEGVGPGAELSGAAFGEGFQI